MMMMSDGVVMIVFVRGGCKSMYKCKELLTGQCIRVENVTSQRRCDFCGLTQPYAMAKTTKVLTQDANIHACSTQQDLPLQREVSHFRTSTCIHLCQTIIMTLQKKKSPSGCTTTIEKENHQYV